MAITPQTAPQPEPSRRTLPHPTLPQPKRAKHKRAKHKAPRGPLVARLLSGILMFQLGIGAMLVLGDVQIEQWRWPGAGPNLPRLSEPVRPGDQHRIFAPNRDRPATRPARSPGTLPDRLVLSRITDTTYRLEGAISDGDAPRMIAMLKQATPTPQALILQSPGGSVSDALELGRHIRAAGMTTQMLAGEYCYSACPYLLAAGTSRQIDTTAQVGVHQHYFGQSSILPAAFAVEDIQTGQGEVMIYLDAMGIDLRLMQHALTTPPDEIYVLLPAELEDYGFIPKPD